MLCIRCGSEAVTARPECTTQGHKRWRRRCRNCRKQFKERSGTMLNCGQYPSKIIKIVVLGHLHHKLVLRDLPKLLPVRGMILRQKTVRD